MNSTLLKRKLNGNTYGVRKRSCININTGRFHGNNRHSKGGVTSKTKSEKFPCEGDNKITRPKTIIG